MGTLRRVARVVVLRVQPQPPGYSRQELHHTRLLTSVFLIAWVGVPRQWRQLQGSVTETLSKHL